MNVKMFSPALLAYETLSAFRITAHVLALLFVNLALRVYQLLRHLIIIIITLQVLRKQSCILFLLFVDWMKFKLLFNFQIDLERKK